MYDMTLARCVVGSVGVNHKPDSCGSLPFSSYFLSLSSPPFFLSFFPLLQILGLIFVCFAVTLMGIIPYSLSFVIVLGTLFIHISFFLFFFSRVML